MFCLLLWRMKFKYVNKESTKIFYVKQCTHVFSEYFLDMSELVVLHRHSGEHLK